MRGQKGITLVALIITIVVMLILAVVAISAVNDQGLFDKANTAVTKYNQAEQNEYQNLTNYADIIQDKLDKMPS